MDIQITKKQLNNYRKLKREIPILEAELEEMKTTDAGLGNSTILDYRDGYPRPQSVVGFDWPLYERRVEALERKKRQLKTTEEWIQNIEDGQARYVFRLRYMEGMNWVKIAAKMGYGQNPDYPRIMIRDKYLRKSGIL